MDHLSLRFVDGKKKREEGEKNENSLVVVFAGVQYHWLFHMTSKILYRSLLCLLYDQGMLLFLLGSYCFYRLNHSLRYCLFRFA